MKKTNENVAKVNKEIGGWDYRGFHIEHRKDLKGYVADIYGDEVFGKTLGDAKKAIDEQVEYSETENKKSEKQLEDGILEFTSKKGSYYLLQVVNGKIRAFGYYQGKKQYWSVTKEIRNYIAGLGLI